jgi:hypothetical protein
MEALHATIEEFAAEGFTHVECYCPRCRMTRLRPISWLPRISMGLTTAQLSERLRCAECGGKLHSVKRGDWKMCWASRWGVAGDPSPTFLEAHRAP